MNYFAHAMPFLDRPVLAVATGIPDWLTVVDRGVRLRARHVEPYLGDADPLLADVAAGVLQHLRDDARFHETRAFAETMAELTVRSRDALAGETGLRPAFLGHLLTEVLLDAALIVENPGGLETYYALLESVDPRAIESAVNRMASQPTDRLAWMIGRFREARILSDYGEDGKLMTRLNQVMVRAKLPPVPDAFAAVLPDARRLVAGRKDQLLEGIPTT
jgi:hypothetical protein